jgi:TM2 domain
MSTMKSKTTAAWLAFVGGALGAHRFYLHGARSRLAWLLPIPTGLGTWGIWRARTYGLDDMLSWVLIPFLGFTLAACALNAIVFGLSSPEDWNQKYNPGAPPEHPSGHTHWGTIGAIVLSLLIGTTILMSSIVFSFQRYFEYQIEEAKKISQ